MAMDWVFIVFAIATVLYTLFLAKEYIADSRIQNSLLEILLSDRFDLEAKVDAQLQELSLIHI